MSSFEISKIKQKLKSLKAEKGRASRAVGLARQEDRSVEPFIAKVRELSQEIKGLESKLKTKTENTPGRSAHSLENLPSQFNSLAQESDESDLSIVDDLVTERWDEYIEKHPNATLYHHSAIRRVVEETFHNDCCYLAALDRQSRVRGVLPLVELRSRIFGHFLVSLPYFNYGGVLASSPQAQTQLLNAAAKRARTLGVKHIEYRQCRDLQNRLPIRSEKVAMLRDLPENRDQLWSELGSKVRAQVNKAVNAGIQVRLGKSELLDDFYQVFSRNMRDLGTPVYSKHLFANLIKYWSDMTILVAYQESRPVSAGLLLGWRDTVEIPWASTIREANRFDANMKLYWEALGHATEAGYKTFDFGRSTIDTNTFRFKKQWGAIPRELYWQYWLADDESLPRINPDNPKYRFLIASWKRLPLFFANLIGPLLVKNIP